MNESLLPLNRRNLIINQTGFLVTLMHAIVRIMNAMFWKLLTEIEGEYDYWSVLLIFFYSYCRFVVARESRLTQDWKNEGKMESVQCNLERVSSRRCIDVLLSCDLSCSWSFLNLEQPISHVKGWSCVTPVGIFTIHPLTLGYSGQ